MTVTINNAFVRTFEGVLRVLAMQSMSKFRGTVMERGNGPGEDHVVETIGAVEMQEKAGRRQATPEIDTPWGNRLITTKTFDVGDTTEKEDKLKMIIDPNSSIATNYARSARRKTDDVIILAADPTTNVLDKDLGVTTFPAAQIIRTGGASEISFDVLTEIREKALKNDIDPDEEMYAAVGPTQIRKLMHDPKCTSADYVAFQAIQAGKMADRYMGFRWIVTNRLRSPGAGRVNCLFYTSDSLMLKVDEDITTEIGKDPSRSFLWRIYARMTIGAVRVEDKKIFVFDAKDTVTLT
jgi:hypothetical protein